MIILTTLAIVDSLDLIYDSYIRLISNSLEVTLVRDSRHLLILRERSG